MIFPHSCPLAIYSYLSFLWWLSFGACIDCFSCNARFMVHMSISISLIFSFAIFFCSALCIKSRTTLVPSICSIFSQFRFSYFILKTSFSVILSLSQVGFLYYFRQNMLSCCIIVSFNVVLVQGFHWSISSFNWGLPWQVVLE